MKNKKKSVLAFIIGLCACNNIFYVFARNNFYLNICAVVCIISLIYIFINEKKRISYYLSQINRSFIFYTLFCLFSIVPALISLYNKTHLLSAFTNGLPLLVLIFIEYFTVICFSDSQENILNGIKYGFIINLIISLIQMLYFKNNAVFSFLYKMFPTPSFQVCGPYSKLFFDQSITTTLKVYFFRAQGLFIETSYFSTFVVGAILIFIYKTRNNYLKIFLSIFSFYLCLISETGNILFILFLLVVLGFISLKRQNFRVRRKMFLIVPLVIIGFVLIAFYAINDDKIMKKVDNLFESANIYDVNNDDRLLTINNGLELIKKYPLGIGYNVTSKLYVNEFPGEKHSYIFSTIIVNFLELGIIGMIFYLIFALKMVIYVLKKGHDDKDILVALSVLGLFLCQATNGINYWNIQYIIILYALLNISYNNLKYEEKVKNENHFIRAEY